MNILEDDAKQLKELIVSAFEDTRYPGNGELLFQYVGGDNERREVADYYKQKPWNVVRFEEDINEHNRDPGALLYDAFDYYLPALLINGLEAVMEDADHAATFIDYLVEHLSPTFLSSPGGDPMSKFGKNQCRAVLEWLDFMSIVYGPTCGMVPVAVREYWRGMTDL